jgi:hypothetical protein
MKTENKILELSFDFSIQIINLYKSLVEKKEYILSKQLLRSGTSIGANVEEAIAAQTRKVSLQKCQLLLKKPGKRDIGFAFWIKANLLTWTILLI